MVRLREVAVEQPLVKEVKRRGGIAYKLVSPGRRNVPDRLCIMPGGRMFFVECKAPGESPRPGQERELKRLRDLGHEAYTLDNPDCSWLFEPAANGEYVPPPRIPKLRRKKAPPEPKPDLALWVRRCRMAGCDNMQHAGGLCEQHHAERERKQA